MRSSSCSGESADSVDVGEIRWILDFGLAGADPRVAMSHCLNESVTGLRRCLT